MLTNSPIVRSPAARALFFVCAAVSVAILLWAHYLGLHGTSGLTMIFFVLFATFDYSAAGGALIILIAAALIARPSWLRPVARWVGDHPVVVAACCAAILAAGTLIVYRNHPLSMDEYAPFFQAQVFASGHLTGRFPAPALNWLVPANFQNYFLYVSHTTGEVASAYWPSFALLLTPFMWLGIPWVCNAAISAMTVVAVHRLALKIFASREAAGFAALLTVASPVFFADGISYYSMSAHLLANTVFVLLLLEPTAKKAFVAGVVGSIALTLHNPVPHFLFALPWIVWLAMRPGGIRLTAWLSAGYVPLCVILGLGWFVLTRGLVEHPAGQLAGAQDLLKGSFVLPNSNVLFARLIGLAKIWVWAVPGLVILAGLGAWRLRGDVRCRLLALSALLTFFGYFFVSFDQGHGWGFRYFHSAWSVLPVLAAGALTVSRTGLRSDNAGEGSFLDEQTRAFVAACALLTLTLGIGQRALQIHEFISDDLTQVPDYPGKEQRVILLDARYSFYGADLVQNDPWLREPAIRMLSHGVPADAAMMRDQFPSFHRVYADDHGEVWSVSGQPLASAPR